MIQIESILLSVDIKLLSKPKRILIKSKYRYIASNLLFTNTQLLYKYLLVKEDNQDWICLTDINCCINIYDILNKMIFFRNKREIKTLSSNLETLKNKFINEYTYYHLYDEILHSIRLDVLILKSMSFNDKRYISKELYVLLYSIDVERIILSNSKKINSCMEKEEILLILEY
jgi:hypothetical protein